MTHLSRRPLHDGWTVRAAAGPVPDALAGVDVDAVVPGSIHVDLLAEGRIPDPFHGDNESLLAWIGLVDWTYRTTFAWTPDGSDRHDLVFDGLDTVATIRLNGRAVGEVANQHRSYRYDVAAHLRDGDNELEVAFRAPVPYANQASLDLGARPRPYPLPYEAIRKSACSFGWDWGIATYTSGIWKPVHLESWSTARLSRTRVVATPMGDGGRVTVDVDVERTDAAGSNLEVHAIVTVPASTARRPRAPRSSVRRAASRWTSRPSDAGGRSVTASSRSTRSRSRCTRRGGRWTRPPDGSGSAPSTGTPNRMPRGPPTRSSSTTGRSS